MVRQKNAQLCSSNKNSGSDGHSGDSGDSKGATHRSEAKRSHKISPLFDVHGLALRLGHARFVVHAAEQHFVFVFLEYVIHLLGVETLAPKFIAVLRRRGFKMCQDVFLASLSGRSKRGEMASVSAPRAAAQRLSGQQHQ